MTEKQFQILLQLYHEYNEVFLSLSDEVKDLYYARLYRK